MSRPSLFVLFLIKFELIPILVRLCTVVSGFNFPLLTMLFCYDFRRISCRRQRRETPTPSPSLSLATSPTSPHIGLGFYVFGYLLLGRAGGLCDCLFRSYARTLCACHSLKCARRFGCICASSECSLSPVASTRGRRAGLGPRTTPHQLPPL